MSLLQTINVADPSECTKQKLRQWCDVYTSIGITRGQALIVLCMPGMDFYNRHELQRETQLPTSTCVRLCLELTVAGLLHQQPRSGGELTFALSPLGWLHQASIYSRGLAPSLHACRANIAQAREAGGLW